MNLSFKSDDQLMAHQSQAVVTKTDRQWPVVEKQLEEQKSHVENELTSVTDQYRLI